MEIFNTDDFKFFEDMDDKTRVYIGLTHLDSLKDYIKNTIALDFDNEDVDIVKISILILMKHFIDADRSFTNGEYNYLIAVLPELKCFSYDDLIGYFNSNEYIKDSTFNNKVLNYFRNGGDVIHSICRKFGCLVCGCDKEISHVERNQINNF